MVPGIPLSSRFRIYKMMVSAVRKVIGSYKCDFRIPHIILKLLIYGMPDPDDREISRENPRGFSKSD